MIYVYAIVDDPGVAVAGLTGLEDVPLVRFSRGRLAAVCSVHHQLDLEPDAATLWQHERVTAKLMEHCAVAPVRFGTVFGDGGKVARVLADQEGRFTTVLARLRGKVELSVRARAPHVRDAEAPGGEHCGPLSVDDPVAYDRDRAPTPLPPSDRPRPCGSGQQYLRSLGKTNLACPNAGLTGSLADIYAILSAHAEDAALQDGAAERMVAAYLVSTGQVGFFERTVIAVGDRHPEVEMSLTGPWAPFSFVGERRAYAS